MGMISSTCRETPFGQNFSSLGTELIGHLRRQQIGVGFAMDRITVYAEQFFESRVDHQVASAGILHVNHRRRVLENGGNLARAFAHLASSSLE
jgi:hypothetical protein